METKSHAIDTAEDKRLSGDMSAISSPTAGLVDLEKELTCSICTEILYQPLTLLDCLHTFCGYCVKEWFSWQVTNGSSGSSSARRQLTCPSCRSIARDTRHDAKVNTLLDLFLQSNPSKARSENEKKEIAEKYKPGENVLSISPDNARSSATEQDLRLLAEVQGMSLRDARAGGRRHRAGSSHSRAHSETGGVEHSRDRRLEEARRRRRAERQLAAPPPPRSTSELTAQESRQIEHQSSLRSLLSSSDGDSGIEGEILRQITEEGLLDGIDLHNLDPAQEDELTERIAEAYRRRFLNQDAQTREGRSTEGNENPSRPEAATEPQVANSRSTSSTSQPGGLEATSQSGASPSAGEVSSHREPRHRRPSPTRPVLSSVAAIASAEARASSDSARPRRSSQSTLPAPTSHRRAVSSSSSSRTGSRDGRRQHPRSRSIDQRPSSNQQPLDTQGPSSPATSNVPDPSPSTGPNSASRRATRTRNDPSGAPSRPPTGRRSNPEETSSPRPLSSPSQPTTPAAPQLYPEPSISCERCGKGDLQYELHKFCNTCKDGNYNICLHCYHRGEGCLHWFGFGDRALANFQRKFPSSSQDTTAPEPPHILQSRKYLKPPADSIQSNEDGSGKTSAVDPARRLLKGNFCNICYSFADDCFWKCDECNSGEWGFCNRCVNRGHCCTHPLLAISRIQPSSGGDVQPTMPPSSSIEPPPSQRNITGSEEYRLLTFSTKCNMCTYPIPPSSTRFHCPECNDGDYDFCTNCYLKLCAQGRISKDNGRNGWRRCLAGHRMVIVGFEDGEDGQRRVIVKDLVGGHAMKDDLDPSSPTSPTSPISSPQSLNDPGGGPPVPVRQDSGKWTWEDVTEESHHPPSTVQRRRINRTRNQWAAGGSDVAKPSAPSFPPSGGIGLRMAAVWQYVPDPEDTDEIMFPRGALVTEAENINDDWFWGCYAGQKGLFPGAHVHLIDRIGM